MYQSVIRRFAVQTAVWTRGVMAGPGRPLAASAFFLTTALLVSGCMAAFVPQHQETPPAPGSLVVEVSGTPGLGFEGSLGTAPASRSVEGSVPARYTVETAVAVAVNLRKASEDGELTVRILRGDQEVARQTTTQPFGSVLVLYRVTR